MTLHFVDKFEARLFTPSKGTFMGTFTIYSLGAGLIIGLIGAFLQIFMEMSTIEYIIAAIGLLFYAYMIKCMIPFVKSVNGTGKKVGYVLMALILSQIAFGIGIYMAMLAIFLIIGYFILKYVFGASLGLNKPKQKATIEYSDGTSEEVEESGRGICGERYYNTKDGDTIIKN